MIYGYVRVSSQGQARDGNSLPEQTERILELYSNAVIVDEASSGAKARVVFDRLVEDMVKGDLLVVTKLDRFCRTTKEGLDYIDILMSKGIKIHILNMGLIEDTPIGRLIVTQLLAFAEFERSMILERTQSGKRYKRATDPDYKEGRPRVNVTESDFKKFYKKQKAGLISVSEAVKKLDISRGTWYNLAKEYAI